MKSVLAHPICLPSLTPSSLYTKTKRDGLPELFKLKDRHGKELVLNPTHEESITHFFASQIKLSKKNLPLRLYQVTNKFRDEGRPKHGLIRCNEFLMKDLYCFDKTEDDLFKTYNLVTDAYNNFFDELQIPYLRVASTGGEIGGIGSHEYHFLSDIGDDLLFICNNCGYKQNRGMTIVNDVNECLHCKSKDVIKETSIEVKELFSSSNLYFYFLIVILIYAL